VNTEFFVPVHTDNILSAANAGLQVEKMGRTTGAPFFCCMKQLLFVLEG
jgi:hypothetical protein